MRVFDTVANLAQLSGRFRRPEPATDAAGFSGLQGENQVTGQEVAPLNHVGHAETCAEGPAKIHSGQIRRRDLIDYFARKIKVLSAEMESFSNDFLNIVKRHFLR